MERQNRNREDMAKGSSGAPLLAGLMIGGLLGAGAMLLFAPQSGQRTREEIKSGAMDLRDRTTDTVKGAADQVRGRAQQVVSDVRSTAQGLQEQGKDIAIDQLDRVAAAARSKKQSLQASKNEGSA